jgi:hypothetical protein
MNIINKNLSIHIKNLATYKNFDEELIKDLEKEEVRRINKAMEMIEKEIEENGIICNVSKFEESILEEIKQECKIDENLEEILEEMLEDKFYSVSNENFSYFSKIKFDTVKELQEAYYMD